MAAKAQSNGLHGTSDHNVTETAFDAVKCKLFIEGTTCATSRSRNSSRVQIVSLGAGFDTLFFRLMQQSRRSISFIEVDCQGIVDAKKDILLNEATFAELFTPDGKNVTPDGGASAVALQCIVDAHQATYSLVSCDLGDVVRLKASLVAAGVDQSLPTLVIAECVVSYLDPTRGTELLRWLSGWFADATAVIYDPFALNDAFGETLQKYFAVKGCELRSLREFQDANDHYRRFLSLAKWETCRIMDMNAIYEGCTDVREKQRLSALEIFDEFADWMLCNAHYAIFLVSNHSSSAPTGGDSKRSLHWSSSFCSGLQRTQRMTARTLHLPPGAPPASSGIIRTFQKSDLRAVQELFETTHLEYKSKAVKKFIANRLRSGDMADVHRSFMQPTTTTGSSSHSNSSCFWVAEIDGVIVGCIGVEPAVATVSGSTHPDLRTAELCRLSVDAKYRRHGIASALVAALEDFVCANGMYTRISLETIGAMDAAQKLYVALQYEEIARETYQSFSLEAQRGDQSSSMSKEQDPGEDRSLDGAESPELHEDNAPISAKETPVEDVLTMRFAKCHTQTAGTDLDLSNLALSDLPLEVLTKFPSLRKLNLRNNALTELPDELPRRLLHLTVLNVLENTLTELPESIGLLRHLQKLNVENNRIARLPASFSKLAALEECNLKSNALEALEDELGNHLPKLKTLFLGSNAQLAVIPRSFGNLSALKTVDLSVDGALTFVPDKIRRLHERNLILHSRAKRRELISRALRVRSIVAQNLSITVSYKITLGLARNRTAASFTDPPGEEDGKVDEPRVLVLQTRLSDGELFIVERLTQLEAERVQLLGRDRARVGLVELPKHACERFKALRGEPQCFVIGVVSVVRHESEGNNVVLSRTQCAREVAISAY
ncbi:Leucine carboxyl methyltransferase 2-like, partial [Globisporangium splendens]